MILRSRGFIWRRRRDLNSRADFSTYSLSRGAPSPAWVRLHVKLCSFRGLSSRLSQNKWRNGWDSFSAENPRRLQHAAGMLPRAAFRIPDSPSSINGGTGGIRTHAPFRTNGFQDRLVMTASIPFRVLPDKQDLLYRINRTLSTLFLQICIKEKPGEIFSGPVYRQSSFIRYFSCRAAARMKYNLRSRLIKTGSMYHGFYTPRGRKFPHGNFRTSVFCGA